MMKLKHTLRQTTTVCQEKWTQFALDRLAKIWPGIEKALLIQAGLGERTATVELTPEGDTPVIVTRLVAVALAEQLKCEGVTAKVLRPEKPEFPWQTPRKNYGVQVNW
jgi:hypothetical protein